MDNYKNLLFFNKEGDYLNFNYSTASERFEGDILFDENSSDTFKTYGLYILEKVPSFEFESPGDMGLNKFQLFNEYGLDFYGAKFLTQSVTKIEPINNDSTFYSKWIYGTEFDTKFPKGTLIRFNESFTEFTSTLKTYTIVSTKKDAIMIISDIDNATFENNYYSIYSATSSYTNLTITGINAIGVYNYINQYYNDNLSPWNEPTFYDKLYNRKKLNIINSDNNDSVVTVANTNISDLSYFEYDSTISTNQDLIIELSTKTDLPKIYEGILNISGYTLEFGGAVPEILKPGQEFKIIGSTLNTNFLVVSSIPTFTGNTQQTFYATQSQVLWNNKIYQCIQAYTQSYTGNTIYINPDDTSYWTHNISYIKVDQSLSSEYLANCQLYLTTNKIYFYYGWTNSNSTTLASAAEKYKDDFKIFDIDLYYYNNLIKADLIYPSQYVEVNYYHTKVGATYSIGRVSYVKERLIEVSEQLNYELNYNISTNFSTNIVFTDIDEYGLKIIINKQVYEEEINWIYSGSSPDMERTIDRTLRNWLVRNYIRLKSIGIISDLQYIGSYVSPFCNSIKLHTEYPNVPMNINDVLVGSTADYYIQHSKVLFTGNDYINGISHIGSYLSININDELYGISTTMLTGTYSKYPDIPATLQAWVDEYSTYLSEYGILVSNINNLLVFDIKRVDRRLDYTINTGKGSIPGLNDYTITKRLKGDEGVLITSNEITLSATSSYSFEDVGFSTGMALSINNDFYPYDNQEFNIQFLDPGVINLSYQGPFWGTDSKLCNSSAFITLAFDTGYGMTGCGSTGSTGGTGSEYGPFNLEEFSSAFALTVNPNTYWSTIYNLTQYPGTNGLVDISYIQLSNSIYAFGDNVTVLDAYFAAYLTTITLAGNTQSIKMDFNIVNNYLYCLSKNKLWVIDPLPNSVVTSITFLNNACDLKINESNGDIYISYDNSTNVDIYDLNNTYVSNISATYGSKMVFNNYEQDMYITSTDSVLRINGSTRAIDVTYGIPGATNSIFYEPVNESIYVYGSTSLWKIDNGITQSIAITTGTFSDIIFNNLTGEMNISDSSSDFRALDLNLDTITVDTSLGSYGYIVLNQFDGDVYLSSKSLNSILVVRPLDGTVTHTEPMSSNTTKIIYNPERKSVWTIQPSENSIYELGVTINNTINPINPTQSNVDEYSYGTLSPDYVPHPDIWLKSKDFLRKPRENYSNDYRVSYYWTWYYDNAPQFFMYDFSGKQLPITGSYAYIGTKPLSKIVLNKTSNTDFSKVSMSEYQQTIFDTINYDLSYIDDETDISTETEPLELFIGFRSDEEGPFSSLLQFWKKEEISIDYQSTIDTIITFETLDINGPDKRGQIKLNTESSEFFIDKGLKEGQHIVIYVKDTNNIKNQYISENNGIIVKIRNIFYKTIIVDFFSTDDYLYNESTLISNYPTTSKTTYLKTTITVIDKEIGRFPTYGQTEIEDIRFKIELGNVGKLVAPNEVFIFKEYDVLEGGIDWTYLNKKRKEMLMMKSLIYPYIGAYKSIINAINFFGYNDLQLNEYYKDINPTSDNFLKLFKVEIPDIFDNTIEGWTENEYIKNNFPNDNYEETNMFNLTYFITDIDGNITINYTIDEIIIKLQGLKYWLKRNIIPLTHKILDITGRSYFKGINEIVHTSYDIRIINNKENMTPITFKLNEAYLMPINSGSTVYNCVIDFYNINNSDVKSYNGVTTELPDYFDISIRTYKTYKEWQAFTTYNINDKVIYYGKIYESEINNNKVNNPRKYESIPTWNMNSSYDAISTVQYERDIFISKTMSSTSSVTPLMNSDWLKITEWKELDLEPVQKIKEFRSVVSGTYSILPFNFTIDSNIDPLLVIEINSSNGYGLNYTDKKNYEIRGTSDRFSGTKYIDRIGPFTPIVPVI